MSWPLPLNALVVTLPTDTPPAESTSMLASLTALPNLPVLAERFWVVTLPPLSLTEIEPLVALRLPSTRFPAALATWIDSAVRSPLTVRLPAEFRAMLLSRPLVAPPEIVPTAMLPLVLVRSAILLAMPLELLLPPCAVMLPTVMLPLVAVTRMLSSVTPADRPGLVCRFCVVTLPAELEIAIEPVWEVTLPTTRLPAPALTCTDPVALRSLVATLPPLAVRFTEPLVAVMVPALMPSMPLIVTEPPISLPTLTMPEVLPASMVRPP